jgi:hypothetical protein
MDGQNILLLSYAMSHCPMDWQNILPLKVSHSSKFWERERGIKSLAEESILFKELYNTHTVILSYKFVIGYILAIKNVIHVTYDILL